MCTLKQEIELRLAQFKRCESGAPTIEFVVLAPVVFLIFFWTLELGIFMYRWAMLERGVDMTVRELMVENITADMSNDEAFDLIKQRICDNANTFSGCLNDLHVELNTTSASSGLPNGSVACVDKSDEDAQPKKQAYGGVCPTGAPVGEAEIVYLRACLLVDPMLTGEYALPFPKDPSGYFQLRSNAAYLNEPC